jgi:hypothetical protein
MANFYKPKSASKKGYDEKKGLQTLAVSEDSVIGLYGGGPPPDNKQLDVVSTDTSVCVVIELDAVDYTHRRFRVVGKAAGSCTIEARLGPTGASWAPPLDINVDGSAATPKQKIVPDLEYDGQQLRWPAMKLSFKATSGITPTPPTYNPDGSVRDPGDPTEYRDAKQQCVKDHGPVPEGLYSFSTKEDRRTYARDNGADTCTLAPGSPIQVIPRGGSPTDEPSGGTAGKCEPYWANWGTHRVRLEPADYTAQTACHGSRSGFYIHDSTKGYSHGCIETEQKFFHELSTFIKTSKAKTLTVRIKYTNQSTYGGTRVP